MPLRAVLAEVLPPVFRTMRPLIERVHVPDLRPIADNDACCELHLLKVDFAAIHADLAQRRLIKRDLCNISAQLMAASRDAILSSRERLRRKEPQHE